MTPERLAQILEPGRAFAYDVETHRTEAGIKAPPLVCSSVARLGQDGHAVGELLFSGPGGVTSWRALKRLLESDVVIVGANIAFDMLVGVVAASLEGVDLMPLVYAAYEAGRVFDVLIAEKLHAIANGHLGEDPRTGRKLQNPETGRQGDYSLAICVDLRLGRKDAKANDEYRSRYHELEDLPLETWPPEARQYPIDDAVNTLLCAIAQVRQCDNLHDLRHTVYQAWCLHVDAAWGLRTSMIATETLAAAAQAARTAGLPRFQRVGFIRKDGSEDQAAVKLATVLAYGADPLSECSVCKGKKRIPSTTSKTKGATKTCVDCNGTGLDLYDGQCKVPMTEPSTKFPRGSVQIGRDQLTESGDELLVEYGTYQEDDKVLDTYVPFLRGGYDRPITLWPNVPLDTGRVSYRDKSQVLPRQVSVPLQEALDGSGVTGVRDCVRARPGWVFYSNDFTGGELVTLSESCVERVGYSVLGEALNRGIDVHSDLGAQILGIRYEEFSKKKHKNVRQAAKPANFGFPGRMGAARLVITQRKQGPDTECEDGPSNLGRGKRGYKGLRFCLLLGVAQRCGEVKLTEWRERPIPPTCRACLDVAEQIKRAWFKKWPEMKPYLDWHQRNADLNGRVVQHYSKRVRGGIDGGSGANGDFQGLLADISRAAHCRVSHEQRVDRSSVLYGNARGIVFAHDELFGEAREHVGAECSERVNEIMIEEFRRRCPRHAAACKAEPTLMRAWRKAAECVRDASGRLMVWEDWCAQQGRDP